MLECDGPRHFVILHATRTGSNYLCTVLNSYPDILCHHELFNPHVVGVARHLQGDGSRLGTIGERDDDPDGFLRRVWQAGLGYAAVGFKLCLWQHEPAWHAVLADRSVAKILLKRRNRVKAFVSLLLARQTGEWVVYDDRDAPAARPRVEVDHRALLDNIALHERFYRETEHRLVETGQAHALLWYEDLFTPGGIAPALAMLGIKGVPVHPRGQTWKLGSASLRDTVANFEDLSRALQGTSLSAELHANGW